MIPFKGFSTFFKQYLVCFLTHWTQKNKSIEMYVQLRLLDMCIQRHIKIQSSSEPALCTFSTQSQQILEKCQFPEDLREILCSADNCFKIVPCKLGKNRMEIFSSRNERKSIVLLTFFLLRGELRKLLLEFNLLRIKKFESL